MSRFLFNLVCVWALGLCFLPLSFPLECRAQEAQRIAFRSIGEGEAVEELRKDGALVIGKYVLSADNFKVLRGNAELKSAFDRIESVKWDEPPFTKQNAQLTIRQRMDDYIQTASDFYDGKGKRPKGVVGERELKFTDDELGDRQLSSALQSVKMAAAWSVPLEQAQVHALNAVIVKRVASLRKPAKPGTDNR